MRKIFFWFHLVIGLAAGGVIAVTAFTGATMAFEKQVIAWQEKDLRQITPPTNASPLSIEEIITDVREDQPGARPSEITVSRNPASVIQIGLGRNNVVYVNPYTGDSLPQGAQKTRAFFQLMLQWHRWLGVSTPPQSDGPGRPANEMREGQGGAPGGNPGGGPGGLRRFTSTVVGVSTCIFFALCLSGLVLWWPRNLAALRQIIWFKRGVRGKARDWNWHNVIGFWSAPILIITTFTGIVMAFRPVGDWIYHRPENENAGLVISSPAPGARPLGPDDLLSVAKKELPQWEIITLRMGGRRQRGGDGGGPRNESGERTPNSSNSEAGNRLENRRENRQAGGREGESRTPQPVSIAVQDGASWSPQPVQLTLDPYTGAVLRKVTLSDMGFRQALRTLNRSLHTGEAGGVINQALSLLACVGALVLIWTGVALSWRRFFKPRST